MKILELPLTVLRIQYRIARFPLELIEDRIVSQWDSEAPGRLLYERSLGQLDSAVGSLLGDQEIERRGSALAERSEALGRAARLDAEAEQTRRESTVKLKAKQDNAIEDRKLARETKQAEIQEAESQAEDDKSAAAAEARERSAEAKREADELAERRTRSAEAAKREEQAEIMAAEAQATATAREKARNADAKRDEAADKRGQADHIEKLADAEQKKRQAGNERTSR
jgi:hypothetical protein